MGPRTLFFPPPSHPSHRTPPVQDKYGTQRVVSFLRQLTEQGGFWRASDRSWVKLNRVQFVGACNPPTDAGASDIVVLRVDISVGIIFLGGKAMVACDSYRTPRSHASSHFHTMTTMIILGPTSPLPAKQPNIARIGVLCVSKTCMYISI